jgi:hypothetical protein
MVRTSQCFCTEFLQLEGPQTRTVGALFLGLPFGAIRLFAHSCNAFRRHDFSSTENLPFSFLEFVVASRARTPKMIEEQCQSRFRAQKQGKKSAAPSMTVD